ncbi:hypothetical protein C8R44DRAFT_848197 [Mycena epipterygia]|nr:hypothetical protein C8R44DRAFT_848197 [Mycena epipterygia]
MLSLLRLTPRARPLVASLTPSSTSPAASVRYLKMAGARVTNAKTERRRRFASLAVLRDIGATTARIPTPHGSRHSNRTRPVFPLRRGGPQAQKLYQRPKCFHCGQPGHLVRDCSSAPPRPAKAPAATAAV